MLTVGNGLAVWGQRLLLVDRLLTGVYDRKLTLLAAVRGLATVETVVAVGLAELNLTWSLIRSIE